MKVSVRVPNRIDFAGGTLDLYPLYLFFDGGITVNAGISLYSYVDIEVLDKEGITINLIDLGQTESFKSINDMDFKGPTQLIQRAVKSYGVDIGMTINTKNEAPKGSGLGASSALLMALSTALLKIKGKEVNITSIINRGASIEAALLGIPTGKQDYYGAVLGKVHALYFDEVGCRPEELPIDDNFKNQLKDSLIISFTGISHYSGANNWDMLKMVIEKNGLAHENLSKIKDIAFDMRKSFIERDLEKVGSLVEREWECRKNLSKGVTNEFIDSIISKMKSMGAYGSKLCGAGGGGCMITLVPKEVRKEALDELKRSGIKTFNASIDYEGMQIKSGGSVPAFVGA